MDIQPLSVEMTQANVQEQAAVRVTENDTEKQQAQAVDNLNSTEHELDPNLGQKIDLTA